MPLCFCFTSLDKLDIQDGFESRLSALVRDLFKKPEEVKSRFRFSL